MLSPGRISLGKEIQGLLAGSLEIMELDFSWLVSLCLRLVKIEDVLSQRRAVAAIPVPGPEHDF